MVVGAAVACRLEAQPLELGRDVSGRGLPPRVPGRAAFERIVGEKLEMGAQDAWCRGRGGTGRRTGRDWSGLLSGGAGYRNPEQGQA